MEQRCGQGGGTQRVPHVLSRHEQQQITAIGRERQCRTPQHICVAPRNLYRLSALQHRGTQRVGQRRNQVDAGRAPDLTHRQVCLRRAALQRIGGDGDHRPEPHRGGIGRTGGKPPLPVAQPQPRSLPVGQVRSGRQPRHQLRGRCRLALTDRIQCGEPARLVIRDVVEACQEQIGSLPAAPQARQRHRQGKRCGGVSARLEIRERGHGVTECQAGPAAQQQRRRPAAGIVRFDNGRHDVRNRVRLEHLEPAARQREASLPPNGGVGTRVRRKGQRRDRSRAGRDGVERLALEEQRVVAVLALGKPGRDRLGLDRGPRPERPCFTSPSLPLRAPGLTREPVRVV